MKLARRIDHYMELLKWPVAVGSCVALPLLIYAAVWLIWDILQAPWNLVAFAFGALVFMTLWRAWLSKSLFGNWLIQFEHELTHAFFAVITGHPIVGFRASTAKGSHVKFLGRGNWLITSGPYFFPTAAAALWIVSWLLPIRILPWTSLVLGFAFGYHIVSTLRETHAEQNDLKELSWRFCWMFLPASNLFVLSILIAYSSSGASGVTQFLFRMTEPLIFVFEMITQHTAQ